MQTISFKLALTSVLSFITYLIGGFDMTMQSLILFMAVDYITGVLKAIKDKEVSSKIGFKGLCKKTAILLSIVVVVQFERFIGQPNTVRNIAAMGFIVNEIFSILENLEAFGIKIPILKKYIDKMREDDDEDKDNKD